MKIIVASTYVPFRRGGGTRIVDDLAGELSRVGHRVDVVKIPLRSAWKEIPAQTLGIRLLDLTTSCGNPVDRLITIRYPSYALSHPNKVAWFDHHRGAYDLWGTPWGDIPDNPEGLALRDLLRQTDGRYLRESRHVYTNSRAAADRLKLFHDIKADGVLYPPLARHHPFREGEFGDYLLYVSRLCPSKRQALAIEAVRHCRTEVRLVLAGVPDLPEHLDELTGLARRCGVERRVHLTGWVSEQQKVDLLADCCGALYLAVDEDSCGSASLEAFHSGKPVITLRDSGASRELIEDGVNGLVADPTPEALAEAMDRLWQDRPGTTRMGRNALRTPEERGITWERVVESLTL